MNQQKAIISAKVFDLDGTKVVTDLYWQTIDKQTTASSERPYTLGGVVLIGLGKSSYKSAKTFASDLMVWRQSDATVPLQIGMAQSAQLDNVNGKPIYSFASLVLGALSIEKPLVENAIVIMPSGGDEDGYLLAAMNAKRIQPAGDTYGNSEEIRKKCLTLSSMGGYEVFAPPELRIPGSKEPLLIGQVLSILGKKALRNHQLISPKPNYKKIMLVGAVVATIAMGAYFFVEQYNLQQQEKNDKAAQEAMKLILANQVVAPVIPKVTLNPPKETFQNCFTAFKEVRLFAGGWAYKQAKCVPGTLAVFYERNNSTIANFIEVYPKAQITLDGDIASTFSDVTHNTIATEHNALLSENKAAQKLNGFAQAYGLKAVLKINRNKPAPSLPGRETVQTKDSNKLTVISWEMELPYLSIIQSFPTSGSSLDEVVFTDKEGLLSVTIKGKMYVKP